jgi:hypothetical protein
MTKPVIKIHNVETNEIVEREMTVAEFKQYDANQKANELKKVEAEAKETERQAIADRLGLTADELKVLLG